jgi:hypothetical protein
MGGLSDTLPPLPAGPPSSCEQRKSRHPFYDGKGWSKSKLPAGTILIVSLKLANHLSYQSATNQRNPKKSPHHSLRRFHHFFHRKPKLLEYHINRSGGAEGRHADEFAFVADVSFPSLLYTGFNSYPCGDCRR